MAVWVPGIIFESVNMQDPACWRLAAYRARGAIKHYKNNNTTFVAGCGH